jgi:sugar transferase (PEP-CTERM/EpsH1 system associated)
MSELLFLAHRIPYPPDKGDKIRSYHLLKALAADHTVHLGTFVDDPADWVHVAAVQRLCKGETCIRPLNATFARLRGVGGFLSGQPLTLAYYRDMVLRRWVRELSARRPLIGAFAFSACMAPYALHITLGPDTARVLDLCDVDSDKWRQYAASHGQPMKMIYAREARTLSAAEADYVRDFDSTLVIAEPEARLLRERIGEHSDRIRVVGNGVDTGYFDPRREYERPFPADARAIVFTGAMDYHANVDGVRWFARDVLPAIRNALPDALFAIVGSNPSADVRALSEVRGVVVTGRVPDVRPYLAHAAAVVAPLRLARGVQNKVLEALAMARPVVATPNAVQGIPSALEAGVLVTADPSAMSAAVIRCLSAGHADTQGRGFVIEHYSWPQRLRKVTALFRTGPVTSEARQGSPAAVA